MLDFNNTLRKRTLVNDKNKQQSAGIPGRTHRKSGRQLGAVSVALMSFSSFLLRSSLTRRNSPSTIMGNMKQCNSALVLRDVGQIFVSLPAFQSQHKLFVSFVKSFAKSNRGVSDDDAGFVSSDSESLRTSAKDFDGGAIFQIDETLEKKRNTLELQ